MAGPLERFRERVAEIIVGKKRNHPIGDSGYLRKVALEIPETLVRQSHGTSTRDLVEMIQYCQPVRKSLRVLLDYLFSSPDGIDQGLSIDDIVGPADGGVAVNPEIKEIGDELLKRIGMQSLRLMAKRVIAYGDAFVEKKLMIDPSTLSNRSISGINVLPTFQVFRLEDDFGRLEAYEQRTQLYSDIELIRFSPIQMTHVRYDWEYLYGRSFFDTSIPDWQNLRDASMALIEAAKISVNPIKYTYPDTWERERIDQFIQQKEGEQRDGILINLFTSSEVEIERLSQGASSTIASQVEAVRYYRRVIKDNCRLPAYLWNDEERTGAARDIAGQPALAFSVLIQSIRQCIGEGIREIIDTELILRGFVDPKSREYQLKWPSVHVQLQGQEDSQDDDGVDSDGSSGDDGRSDSNDDDSEDELIAGSKQKLIGVS